MEIDERALAAKFEVILPHLDERQRRLLLAAEARSLGYGGVSLVARAAGVSRVTVTAGVDELEAGTDPMPGRARRPGGGRMPLTEADQVAGCAGRAGRAGDPGRSDDPVAMDHQVDPQPGRGTGAPGAPISHHSVGRLLAGPLGYSLQANAKTVEGRQHPDRDAQFGYINDRVTAAIAAGEPVISVDAKKKELIGEYASKGRTWRPAGNPRRPKFTTSPASRARPYRTASTTWAPTRAGCPWAATATPRNSLCRPSAAGGPASAAPPTPARRSS